MRIIEHGNQYEIGELTCPNCECKFAYTKADVKIEEWTDYNSYYHDRYDEQVVYCPECRTRMTLNGKEI